MSHESFVYFVEGKRRELAVPWHPSACLNFPVYIHILVTLILYVLQVSYYSLSINLKLTGIYMIIKPFILELHNGVTLINKTKVNRVYTQL